MGWKELCAAYNVPYYKGAKTNGGNIEIQCPLCGTEDRKHHMGLNLTSSMWSCWKNRRDHSGRHPNRLICALLMVDYDEAESIARQYFLPSEIATAPDPSLLYASTQIKPIPIPEHFYPFRKYQHDLLMKLQQPFVDYIRGRGMDPAYVGQRFDLRWSVTGEYAQRIIVPITDSFGQWMTFTSRSISSSPDTIRYLTCGEISNRPDYFLFDDKNINCGGDMLVINEGTFDSMKLTSAMIPGVVSTASFGKNISAQQQQLLIKLSPYYKIILLAFDRDAKKDAIKFTSDLQMYVPNLTYFDHQEKDFGSMSISEIRESINEYIVAHDVYNLFCQSSQLQDSFKFDEF